MTSRDLYTPHELFAGFHPDETGSYERTLDAQTYLSTRRDWTDSAGAMRAAHDHAITVARDTFIAGRRVVAVMGGHAEPRGSATYRAVAMMANHLAQQFVVASGGGPGAMEATHLGALITDDEQLRDAVDYLADGCAEFPHGLKRLVTGGVFDPALVGALHAWQAPAFRLLESIDELTRRPSLAIPTWFYGHEPPTPFASHIAKYFHNAIREDGLLAVARAGIVFAPGKAGTLQEIFQDAAQNYYESFGHASPMAFLDIDGYWSSRFRVESLLKPLFGPDRYARWVLISGDPDEIIEFINSNGR
jgi:predicted Rossmann-fold nucleotide-binding protein